MDNSTPGEEDDEGDDTQVVSHEIHDAQHLNRMLLEIHNSSAEGLEGPHDSDAETQVSLASTLPLGPPWEDDVPAASGQVHQVAEPQPVKEEQHIAKAKRELSMSVPWQNMSGHNRMFTSQAPKRLKVNGAKG